MVGGLASRSFLIDESVGSSDLSIALIGQRWVDRSIYWVFGSIGRRLASRPFDWSVD